MAMSIVEDLVSLSQQVSVSERPRVCQKRNSEIFIQRVTLVAHLFEEVRDCCMPLPPSVLLGFKDFYAVLQKISILLRECRDGSRLWCLFQSETISQRFQEISLLMAATLRRIPLNMLDVSSDVKEQVELVQRQSEKAKKLLDPFEQKMQEELLQLLGYESQFPESSQLRNFFDMLQIHNISDMQKEIHCLEEEIQSSTSHMNEIITLSTLERLLVLSLTCQRVLYGASADSDQTLGDACATKYLRPAIDSEDASHNTAKLEETNPPDEFNCPISLDLIRDPVVIATGHTFDRSSITQWIAAGNRTCPKSGMKLIHLSFTPNYALKSLINMWCKENKISSDCSNDEHNICRCSTDSLEITKMTAAFLVGKLSTGTFEVQQQAVYELRLLAKTGMENRRCIAEAGAIPFLVPLLSCRDSATQINAVTALLNLSIYNNNKPLIIAADALDPIIDVIRAGNSMEARENAAATVFSLSVVDEYKVTIGSISAAIPALLSLLLEGTAQGKKDALSTLFNLSLHNGNIVNVVRAGVIPVLVDILKKDGAESIDDALAVLALLAGSVEALPAINALSALPFITKFLKQGSSRAQENAARVVLSLCRAGGEAMKDSILKLPEAITALQFLVASGTPRARRKARSALKLLVGVNTNNAAYSTHFLH